MSAATCSLDEWVRSHEDGIALVFSDIVSSTFLLYEISTTPYKTLRRECFDQADAIAIGLCRGRLINTAGDALFHAFPSVTTAYNFAGQFFVEAAALGVGKLRVRIGIHFGRPTTDGSDLVGRDVHIAARVAQHGIGAEIWVSEAAKNALERESPDRALKITWLKDEECELHGVPDKQRLWRAA